jgi:hypothetical protein
LEGKQMLRREFSNGSKNKNSTKLKEDQ